MFFFSFFFLLQSSLLSLSPSLFLLTLVFRKEHVRDPLFDRKLPPGLRAHQRSLDEAKLEQRVVERFQKSIVAQVLFRWRVPLQGRVAAQGGGRVGEGAPLEAREHVSEEVRVEVGLDGFDLRKRKEVEERQVEVEKEKKRDSTTALSLLFCIRILETLFSTLVSPWSPRS